MNRNRINLAVGILLMVLFLFLLVAFQVRQTELAIVTTFSKVSRTHTEPGLKFRLPWPIQKVYYLDRRVQNFESTLDETQTIDRRNLLISVYFGWAIADPQKFFINFPGGSVTEAAKRLDEMIRSKKNETVGQHPFSHFISTNPGDMKFAQVEEEMLAKVRAEAAAIYGMDVKFIRIKRLQLPTSNTEEVFKRMQSELQGLVGKYREEGQSKATSIRTAADRDREKILAEADREASQIRGQGELKAAEAFRVFEQSPELAILLLKLKALEQSLQERTTLILDQRTPPFDLLKESGAPLSLRQP
jgi:membrane protease subunit HflC